MDNKNDYYNSDRKKRTDEFAMKAVVYCGIALVVLSLIAALIG